MTAPAVRADKIAAALRAADRVPRYRVRVPLATPAGRVQRFVDVSIPADLRPSDVGVIATMLLEAFEDAPARLVRG